MERCIVGFRQDDEGHWVAKLECGHEQHVRHDPPWQVRPWVITEAGRAAWLGRPLDCPACESVTGSITRPTSPTSPTSPPSEAETQLSAHIFAVSAGLVGVCLTVIGIFRVLVRSDHVDSIADNVLAVDALLFLAACFFSYLALRSRTGAHARRLERVADGFFLTALTFMVIVGGLIAYEIV